MLGVKMPYSNNSIYVIFKNINKNNYWRMRNFFTHKLEKILKFIFLQIIYFGDYFC